MTQPTLLGIIRDLKEFNRHRLPVDRERFREHIHDLEQVYGKLLYGVARCAEHFERDNEKGSVPQVIFEEMLGLPPGCIVLEHGDIVLKRDCPACDGKKDEVHADECPALRGDILFKTDWGTTDVEDE